jgi:hypothetical protein
MAIRRVFPYPIVFKVNNYPEYIKKARGFYRLTAGEFTETRKMTLVK